MTMPATDNIELAGQREPYTLTDLTAVPARVVKRTCFVAVRAPHHSEKLPMVFATIVPTTTRKVHYRALSLMRRPTSSCHAHSPSTRVVAGSRNLRS